MNVRVLVLLVGLTIWPPLLVAKTPSTEDPDQTYHPSTDVARLLSDGASALGSGEIGVALELYQEADTLAGGRSWDAAAGVASASLQLGKIQQALDSAERMLEIDQTSRRRGIALQLQGSCFAQKNKLNQAEAALREALELLPGRPLGTRTALAGVLCRKKKEDEALDLLDDGGLCEQKHSTVVDPTDPDRPVRWELDGPLTEPVKLSGGWPPYPEAARRARVQGAVVMGTIIGKDGNIKCLRVLDGLSHGLNCSAALSMINWKFSPSTYQGEPLDVYYILTFSFGIR